MRLLTVILALAAATALAFDPSVVMSRFPQSALDTVTRCGVLLGIASVVLSDSVTLVSQHEQELQRVACKDSIGRNNQVCTLMLAMPSSPRGERCRLVNSGVLVVAWTPGSGGTSPHPSLGRQAFFQGFCT